MEDKKNTTNGDLLQAGVNLHVDIPNKIWIGLGTTVIISGAFLILLSILKKSLV